MMVMMMMMMMKLFDWNDGREVWRGDHHTSSVWGLDIDPVSQVRRRREEEGRGRREQEEC